ncbi:TonB-dependent receptor [Campylobacter troglodytis]|nr:TonB-dependent receptor [Campylobacter troglodytis]
MKIYIIILAYKFKEKNSMKIKLALVFSLTVASFADDELKKFELESTTIQADLFPYQSGSSLSQEYLSKNPTGNGDITSILRVLPNVQFDNKALSSNSPGEIDPAKISISGGLYYQNAFIIDGMSANNDLTGGVGIGTSSLGFNEDYTPAEQRGFVGRSQALNIDTSLLESIKVQDSNIAASYGGFTGGVVEATTKRAEKDFGANISYQISQGNANEGAFSLTNYHIFGDKEAFLRSTLGRNQPKFTKHSFRSSFESKINENFGILASFTTTQSIIPRKNPESMDENSQEVVYKDKKELRQSYNFFVKAHYQASDKLFLESSYAFMPQYNRYFDSDAKDSDTTIKMGGHQFGTKAIIDNNFGFLTASANVNFFEESRRSKEAVQKRWSYSATKNWGNSFGESWEGGYGDEDMKQNEVDLRLTQNITPYASEKFENALNFGFELGYTRAYFHRLKDSYLANVALPLANADCVDEYCYFNPSTNEGQYFMLLQSFKAGKFALDSTSLALFAEDEIKFDLGKGGGLNARLGLRMDHDTYMSKYPLAPRLALSYIAPWKSRTSLNLGANRYYGRSLFAYRFNDGLGALEENYFRSDANEAFDENTLLNIGTNDTNFKKIKIPYDDELNIGITQQLGAFELNTKYIHRFGRDQVRRTCILNQNGECPQNPIYTYDNNGKSDSDIVAISLANYEPFELSIFSNYFSLAYDYTNTKRSYNDYAQSYNPAATNTYVLYRGSLQRIADLNVANFARPHTLRLNTTHSFKLGRTSYLINNFFRYRSAYKTTISRGGSGSLVDPYIYDDTRIGGALTWDMRVGFDLRLYKSIFYANIDIFNVLDRTVTTVYNSSKSSPTLSYEVGRQFWLQVGYRY